MLGSEHDGERAAAALMATKLLKSHDTTWHDFIMGVTVFVQKAEQKRTRDDTRGSHWSEGPRTDAEWLRALKTHCWDLLSEWERTFVADVLQRNRWPLTPKQREVLLKLKDRHCHAYA